MPENPIQKALNVLAEATDHCPTPKILQQLLKDLYLLVATLEERVKKS